MDSLSDAEIFVRLKYPIVIIDNATWKLCNGYPSEVLAKWAWRCADDVEYVVAGHPECVEVYKACRAYDLTGIERAAINIGFKNPVHLIAACNSAFYAATHNNDLTAVYAAEYACRARIDEPGNSHKYGEIYERYVGWLIEELIRYESSRSV